MTVATLWQHLWASHAVSTALESGRGLKPGRIAGNNALERRRSTNELWYTAPRTAWADEPAVPILGAQFRRRGGATRPATSGVTGRYDESRLQPPATGNYRL